MTNVERVIEYLEDMEQVVVGLLVTGKDEYVPIEMVTEDDEESAYAIVYVALEDYEDNGYEVDGLNWLYRYLV